MTDAKSQQKKFTYDIYGRVAKITAPGQTITYSYGSSYDSSNTLGRVKTISYSVGAHSVQEGYNYTSNGDVAAKGIGLDGNNPLNQGALIATYAYTNEGRPYSVAYPQANTSGPGQPAATYTFGLDSMSRLNTMTDQNNNTLVSAVTYSPAKQILSLTTSTFTETSTYNANLQLATLVSGSYSYQYNYSATQNNGRVASIKDNSSGETITYLYDSLNRLIQASGANDPHGSWSQQFTYDGFGNLTQKIGSNAPNNLTINVDPTTNRLTGNGAVYDANGNLTQYNNTLNNPTTYSYDSFNRLTGATGSSITYGYDASNQRVYSTNGSTETFFFYGADGKKLGVWTIPPLSSTFTLVSLNTWFGGRLLKPQDRLNSIGKYFPYGEDRYSPSPANPPNGQEKFATYTRDAETGLDYAYQRYFTAGLGRFMTPDPYRGNSGGPADAETPQSWNRYAYTQGDPTNLYDPIGFFARVAEPDPIDDCSDTVDDCGDESGRGVTPGNDGIGVGGGTGARRTKQKVTQKGSLTTDFQAATKKAIAALGAGCQKFFNTLNGGLSALKSSADSLQFFDGTQKSGDGALNAAVVLPGATDETLQQYASGVAAVVLSNNLGTSNGVVVGTIFQYLGALQGVTLVPEDAHYAYQLSDEDFYKQINSYDPDFDPAKYGFTNVHGYSQTFTAFLAAGCPGPGPKR